MEEDLVRMATELTRHANQLHEIQLELQRLATTTSQAEERATVAEEKACAAVTAIGMVKAPEQKKTKLNNRDAEKFWPETYTADRADKKSFAEFLGEVEIQGPWGDVAISSRLVLSPLNQPQPCPHAGSGSTASTPGLEGDRPALAWTLSAPQREEEKHAVRTRALFLPLSPEADVR